MKQLILCLTLLSAFSIGAAIGEEQITATIIGSGSPLYNENRASASVLITAGDTKILVDMGNGTQANLHKIGVETRKLDALIFTHHHLDHNEEFAPLFIRSLLGRHKFLVVGPPGTQSFTRAYEELYKEDISYRLSKSQRSMSDRAKSYVVKDIKGGETFRVHDIRISTIKVPHTIHTVAYRFDYKGHSIVVTGDLTYTKDLVKIARDADLMIMDSGGMIMSGGKSRKRKGRNRQGNNSESRRKKGKRVKAHLSLADSSLLARECNVKMLVYTHFTSGDVNEAASLDEIRKNYKGQVIFGEDLMVLSPTIGGTPSDQPLPKVTYPVVDTNQTKSYTASGETKLPTVNDRFYGQDANYQGYGPSYTDNLDGTITDNITGLIWQKSMGTKLSYDDATHLVKQCTTGGHKDWRVPTIKELYSLIQFNGQVKGQRAISPFIDTKYFKQPLGNTRNGEREIDAQTWSSTIYTGKTMRNDETVFGVNFVDGRIKGYPRYNPRTRMANKMYFRFVRGNTEYGKNKFADKGDMVHDSATGLTWQKFDSQKGMTWEEALKYAENLTLGGHTDWRLPNAKELQSIVDYSRSLSKTDSPAISSVFQTTAISNENKVKDFPYFWSSTTHLDGPVPEKNAAYVAFGYGLGQMHGRVMDVHGAGSQRSDPKVGFPTSRGPQGDYIRIYNFVRCVRGGPSTKTVAARNTTTVPSGYSTNVTRKSSITDSTDRSSKNKITRGMWGYKQDKNKDGKVSESEFRGPSRRFRNLDKNNDGFLTANESPF